MTTLVLDSPTLELRNQPGGLAVYRNGIREASIPVRLLDRVIVQGSHSLNSAVLCRILGAGASVLLLSSRTGKLLGTISGPLHSNASIRLAQYRLVSDPFRCAGLARFLVRAKLRNQHLALLRMLKLRPVLRTSFFQPLSCLAAHCASLGDTLSIPLSSILGIEGAAARSYFSALVSAFPDSLAFSHRTRRPPRDPVNVGLSLAYTILLSEAIQASHVAGLDPALGFFHQPAFSRPSLACDLLEPLRPHADLWVWSLFHRRLLRPEHFRFDGSACRMGKAGRTYFYSELSTLIDPARRQLRRYAGLLVRILKALPAPASGQCALEDGPSAKLDMVDEFVPPERAGLCPDDSNGFFDSARSVEELSDQKELP